MGAGPASTPPTSGRYVLIRFAAHLAHRLNAGHELNLGALYRQLIDLLAGGMQPPETPNAYRDRLVCAHLLGPDVDAEHAAVSYFERVVNRRLFLARAERTHKAHLLLLQQCRRGLDPVWRTSQLVRSRSRPRNDRVAKNALGISEISERLAEMVASSKISEGNPAANTRAEHGHLWLTIGNVSLEVPEELSIWNAIAAGPRQLEVLAGVEFDAFCSLLIKALETANAHWGALVGIGLSPLAWSGALSLNTAKRISAFLSSVPPRERERIVTWREAWRRRPVPGFATADDLWSSPLGLALRGARVTTIQLPLGNHSEILLEEPSNEGEIDWESFPRMLTKLANAGVLDAYDVWLLKNLNQGKFLGQVAKSPRTLMKFGALRIPESYVEGLLERIRSHESD